MRLLPAFLAAACLGGCASEVVRHASVMSAPAMPGTYRAGATTEFRLDTGYSRSIMQGTEFVALGSISEGRVLKPTRATITIEGAHMHEAYPVERDGRLVGFYLPVEKAFSPLSKPVPFTLQGASTK